ncbi:DUF3825 domain-containing protein [Euzebya sp.]|uniref:DUF3825 domain-containing protein n=1 Tax=Euzebya sp. TaxID=1971409 RepID=UPI0035148325
MSAEPKAEDLLRPFEGYRPGAVQGLKQFSFVPDEVRDRLASLALDEDWGENNFVLVKYLAVQVPLSLQQGRYTWFNNQLTLTAGTLQTRYGTPLYIIFERNERPDAAPWFMRIATDRPMADELPQPANLPDWPDIALNSEIVIAHEHILDDNKSRVAFLEHTPPVAQMCAVAGAIQWSIHRRLYIPQLYWGTTSYFVPVYLTSREDITAAPDLVAPVQVQPGYLVARTLLEPYMSYARARVVAPRADQLPTWLVSAWRDHSQHVSEEEDELA